VLYLYVFTKFTISSKPNVTVQSIMGDYIMGVCFSLTFLPFWFQGCLICLFDEIMALKHKERLDTAGQSMSLQCLGRLAGMPGFAIVYQRRARFVSVTSRVRLAVDIFTSEWP